MAAEVSMPIWDSGTLLASMAAVRCNRCDRLGPCVELINDDDERVRICVGCFCQLAYAVGKFAGDTLREEMGKGLRDEPPTIKPR